MMLLQEQNGVIKLKLLFKFLPKHLYTVKAYDNVIVNITILIHIVKADIQ